MKKEKATETLPTRMTRLERPLIKKAADASQLSESRFLVTAALLLADFGTGEELRSALGVGHQLVNTRLMAVAQVRMSANQIELLRRELQTQGQVKPEKLEKVLDEVVAAMKQLRAKWRRAQSAK
jgi:hypothetical protein